MSKLPLWTRTHTFIAKESATVEIAFIVIGPVRTYSALRNNTDSRALTSIIDCTALAYNARLRKFLAHAEALSPAGV